MKSLYRLTRLTPVHLTCAVVLALIGTATIAKTQSLQCVETNGVKVLWPPNIDGGWDVKDSRNNIVLADDFPCTTTGPITDIHLWGSWLNNNKGTVTNFWIGIYDDVPAITSSASGQVLTNSHPGTNLLWQQSFGPGHYAELPAGPGSESFFDPSIPNVIGTDTAAYYYCFYPTNPFVQQGTANRPTNYWLAVWAQFPNDGTVFGWKTALTSYNDPAVWGTVLATSGLPIGNWKSMTNTQTLQPVNLAFKLTTPTNTPPPQGCIETNGTKYVQWPNLNSGFDVWDNGPWVLADDFKCTNSGPVTDIHLWGSWLNDQVGTNLTFWLAIYADVPANPLSSFSHPGNLLWQEQFAPSQYIQSFWSFGQESFLDPGPPQVIGPDSQVWYYCFYPTNIFVQQGTANNPTNYWLMVYAQPPAGNAMPFGWKTTTNVQNDVSVHAPWPGSPPPIGAPWTKTQQASTGGPLDLAFKITTATNSCPTTFVCQPDQTVECGSSWSFSPPGVLPSSCCPTPLLPTLIGVVTNESNPCKKLYTATWQITNCFGTVVGNCSQTVTVVDTTPPVITCATNKTVVNGSAWTFDPPTAVDACSGTNVVINVFSTVTNGSSPCQQTFTRTWQATDLCSNNAYCSQTVTNTCLTAQCVETNGIKYLQGPKFIGGFDVWNTPYVLADDFVCVYPGPISDIHLWGSWRADAALTNTIIFWLGIYDDVPAITNVANIPSHPGTNLVWQQWFSPGQYAETIATANAAEQFLDPGQTNILGTDSVVWYYCFYPTNPFVQRGTISAPKTYWLAAHAQLPVGIQIYGWKTTTNVLHDVSVHAFWPGVPPTNNPGWTPTVYQPPTGGQAVPLDLAFKLTTPTNGCGPLFIDYIATNKVVLTWLNGILQVSTNVIGPYVDVPGATPPYYTNTTLPFPPTNRFYRVRCPSP